MSSEMGIWTQLIGDLGSLGFILYLVHRTTTHTIPRLAAEYMESEKRAREDFREILKQQRSDFRTELEREREVNSISTDRIVEAMRTFGK